MTRGRVEQPIDEAGHPAEERESLLQIDADAAKEHLGLVTLRSSVSGGV